MMQPTCTSPQVHDASPRYLTSIMQPTSPHLTSMMHPTDIWPLWCNLHSSPHLHDASYRHLTSMMEPIKMHLNSTPRKIPQTPDVILYDGTSSPHLHDAWPPWCLTSMMPPTDTWPLWCNLHASPTSIMHSHLTSMMQPTCTSPPWCIHKIPDLLDSPQLHDALHRQLTSMMEPTSPHLTSMIELYYTSPAWRRPQHSCLCRRGEWASSLGSSQHRPVREPKHPQHSSHNSRTVDTVRIIQAKKGRTLFRLSLYLHCNRFPLMYSQKKELAKHHF